MTGSFEWSENMSIGEEGQLDWGGGAVWGGAGVACGGGVVCGGGAA